MATTRIDKQIVESSKKLLDGMGIGYMTAPSEGEAQASYMCSKGMVYAAGSQDYDTLLFGSKLVVRNLTISGRRKLPMKNVYVNVVPEIVSLSDTLSALGINQDQLIWIGLMLGTDFNEGIKGIGPKTALKIASSCTTMEQMQKAVMEKAKVGFGENLDEVVALFKSPEVNPVDEGWLESAFAAKPDREGMIDFMCKRHGFDEQRIGKFVDMLSKSKSQEGQKGMDRWLK
jgi:flap endonuclease-1